MDKIPLYFVLMIVAVASAPLDIYQVCSRGLGTVKAEPWRRKMAMLAQHVSASLIGRLRRVLGLHRGWVMAAACLIALVAMAHYGHGVAAAPLSVAIAAGHLNIDQLDRDLMKKSGEASSLLESTMKSCQAHEEKDKDGKVVSTGRLMTADETKAIQTLIDEGNVIKAQIARAKGDQSMSAAIAALTAGMAPGAPAVDGVRRQAVIKSLGQQWVESKDYLFAKAKAMARATNWSSDGQELLNTTMDETSGSGGQLIVADYRPGILPLLFKRLTISDLLASGTTESNLITYMRETTFTNAAAAVAEGGTKPESTLVFDQVSDAVKKIAHWLPVTDEMLEDVSQIRSYIDSRLRLGLDITKEDQLLNGDGTAANVTGLVNRSGLTTAEARGSNTNADAIFIEMMKVFNASFVMPTGVVMNPANWQTTQLSKDGEGRYYGSGPFAGAQSPVLWGLPVAVTPSIVANTALTGAFSSAAQVFNRGGVRVEASNSHSDFFVRNLTAIRAEERLALAVYRPAAFGKVTGLE